MEDSTKLIADLEAEDSVLEQQIAEIERELQRPSLDELRKQQQQVRERLEATRQRAEEERRARHQQVRASYEEHLAIAEEARAVVVKSWRSGSLALGTMGEVAQQLAHDRVALQQFERNFEFDTRDRAVFAPFPCRAEFAEDLEFVEGSFSPECWPVMYPARKRS